MMSDNNQLSRRRFLKTCGALLIGARSWLQPGALWAGSDAAAASSGSVPTVVVDRVEAERIGYEDYAFLKDRIGRMTESVYERAPFFSQGDRIAIKVNIGQTRPCLGKSAVETYDTHPLTTRALAEILLDLGAGAIDFIEGATVPADTIKAFVDTGYREAAQYVNARMIDLNRPGSGSPFIESRLDDYLVSPTITHHPILAEADCLASLAKLKHHAVAGVTLSMKNMIGALPMSIYAQENVPNRGVRVHGDNPGVLVASNVVDLCRLFPIDFAFIDGMCTIYHGEGPWRPGVVLARPGVLIASNNAAAADAVGADLLGVDPDSEYFETANGSCLNHIRLAAKKGIGPNRLEVLNLFNLAS